MATGNVFINKGTVVGDKVGGLDIIDDTSTSAEKVWSASKNAQELSAINTNLLQRFHIVKFQIETTGSSDFGHYVYVGDILEVEINRLGLTNLKAIIPLGCTKYNDNGNGGYIVPYSANGLESPIDMNYGINVKNQGTYTVNFLVVTY